MRITLNFALRKNLDFTEQIHQLKTFFCRKIKSIFHKRFWFCRENCVFYVHSENVVPTVWSRIED